jgi:hypothetical protein
VITRLATGVGSKKTSSHLNMMNFLLVLFNRISSIFGIFMRLTERWIEYSIKDITEMLSGGCGGVGGVGCWAVVLQITQLKSKIRFMF